MGKGKGVDLERFPAGCPRCKVPAGYACRNYKGQNKQTCTERFAAVERVEEGLSEDLTQGELFGPDAVGPYPHPPAGSGGA